MIRKLVRALSKVPGLGWLRGLASGVEGDDEPAAIKSPDGPQPRASQPRRDEGRPGVERAGARRGNGATARPATASRDAGPSARRSVAAGTGEKLAAAASGRSAGAESPLRAAGDAEPAAEFRQAPTAPTPPGALSAPASAAGRRLGLAAVGPGRAFAFWEVSAQALQRARQYLGERNRAGQPTLVVLRAHDITQIEFDGTNARRTMDLTIADSSAPGSEIKGRRYLDLWTDDPDTPAPSRVYCELGVQDSDGDFVALAWSPILDLPAMAESPPEPLVHATVNAGSTAPWGPRLEPRPTVDGIQVAAGVDQSIPPGEAGVATATGEADAGAASMVPSSRADAAPVPVDLPASARWSASSPSSAELVKDRAARAGGLSSGLLARRERS